MDWQLNKTEVDVFRDSNNKQSYLQQQLEARYHSDQILYDRHLTAVGIPSIQSAQSDRMP